MIFMPGNNPGMLLNADILGADAAILDLEDAVSPAEKDAARILVRNAIKTLKYKCEVCVRINSIDTTFWKEDLDEILPLRPDLIMPPKISTAQDVLVVDAYMTELEKKHGMEVGTVKLIPLIETGYRKRLCHRQQLSPCGGHAAGRRRSDHRSPVQAHQGRQGDLLQPQPYGGGRPGRRGGLL